MAAGGPTAQQQYMLQLVNEARTNPQAAADRVTSNLTPDVSATLDYYHVDLNSAKQAIATSAPKPPLAWNPALAAAAQGHSQDMANTQVQSHSGSNGSSPDQRMEQAGYTNHNSTGENAYAYSTSVDEAMQAFLLDWGVSDQGHRRNLLQPNVSSSNSFRDVGIGIVGTNDPKFGPMVITQDFGSRPNSLAQLVGVAYYDNQHSQFYAPGEGQGNVQIDATNLATGDDDVHHDLGFGRLCALPRARQVPGDRQPGRHGHPDGHADDRDGQRRAGLHPHQPQGRPLAGPGDQFHRPDQQRSTASVTPVATPTVKTVSAPQAATTFAASVASQAQPASAPSVNYNPSLSGNWTSWKAQLA